VSDISDHLPVLAWVDLTPLPLYSKTDNSTRRINDQLIEHLGIVLSQIDWSRVSAACEAGDPNLAYALFYDLLKNAYDQVFPVVQTSQRKSNAPKQPWMTRGLLKSCRKKAKLHLKYIKNPNSESKEKFTKYRNKFRQIRIKAEQMYYATEFSKYNHNLKKTWCIIRSLLKADASSTYIDCITVNGAKISNASQMAEKFNAYFTSIGQSLAENIPTSKVSYRNFLKPPPPNSFVIQSTSPEEIINLGRTIKPTHSSGPDDIDPCIANPNLRHLAVPLAMIVNSSFDTGIVPIALKMAKVIPIFKQGNKEEVANYRPISILPYCSKILEKVMYERLYSYATKMNILYPQQHGFQSGHSTSMALLGMQDRVSHAIDANEFSLGIFFDLAKAFDTVDHTILLKKLENYGIRDTPLRWFYSYLDQRQQQVVCNGLFSKLRFVHHGVPQGSNLGPLLFLLYINDLPNSSSVRHFILFADDTNVFYSHKSLDNLMDLVNSELATVADWFRANRLSLNLSKTNFIIFRSHRKSIPNQNFNISIDNKPILQVKSTKFLGVYVDEHLTWKQHITQISNKIAKNVGILSRISYLLPRNIISNLYYSLIQPYLIYCNIVWASNYQTRLMRLHILQKRAVRIIAGVPYNSHTSQIFQDLRVLKIDQINKSQICEFMFRFANNLLPPAFKDYFPCVSDVHDHYTRARDDYRTGFARTNSRLFSIKCTGPTAWNSVSLNIRKLPNLYLFKKSLRESLLDS